MSGSSSVSVPIMKSLAEHAKVTFEELRSASPEFESAVSGRTFRISVTSGHDVDAREICRVVDGQLERPH